MGKVGGAAPGAGEVVAAGVGQRVDRPRQTGNLARMPIGEAIGRIALHRGQLAPHPPQRPQAELDLRPGCERQRQPQGDQEDAHLAREGGAGAIEWLVILADAHQQGAPGDRHRTLDEDQVVLERAGYLLARPAMLVPLPCVGLARCQALAGERRRADLASAGADLPVEPARRPSEADVESVGVDRRVARLIDPDRHGDGIALAHQRVGHALFGIMFEQHAHHMPCRPQGDRDGDGRERDQAGPQGSHAPQAAPPVSRYPNPRRVSTQSLPILRRRRMISASIALTSPVSLTP